MIKTDMHTHSCASPDGESRMDEIYTRAKSLGAQYVCITDHCEVFDWKGKWGVKNIDLSRKLYEELGEKEDFLFGVEIGGADSDFNKAAELIRRYDFDFILGSVHNLKGMRDFYYLNYDELDANELLNRYFNTAEEIIEKTDFDSLAHITYPLRYIPCDKCDINLHMEHIERVLVKLIKSGRALEVNTSGLRKPEKVTYPDEKIIRLYKNLGGKYITIGSDGHFPQDVGAGIKETEKMIKEIGFNTVCIYKKRKRYEINL